ncbi:MAG: MarR family transcriptional regulator [Ignavibacteria bacterium]|nr:MarR family transcriptional regulator [Ignavibacteria bacterium]
MAKSIPNTKDFVESTAELLCDLTRMCTIKEEHFASGYNLTPGEFRLLKLFVFKDQYSVKELCELMNLTPGRITHLVNSLEKKNLIIKKTDLTDKRNIKLYLSKKSSEYLKNVYDNHISFHENLLSNINESEKKDLIKSLTILVDSFKQWISSK